MHDGAAFAFAFAFASPNSAQWLVLYSKVSEVSIFFSMAEDLHYKYTKLVPYTELLSIDSLARGAAYFSFFRLRWVCMQENSGTAEIRFVMGPGRVWCI